MMSWSTVPLERIFKHLVPLDVDGLQPQPPILLSRGFVVARPAELFPQGVRPGSNAVPEQLHRFGRVLGADNVVEMRSSAALLEVVTTVAACNASERASGPRSPSARTRKGKVRPCSSKVPAVTTIAAKISVSRCGTSAGINSAAARVTTPRIPAQPITRASTTAALGRRRGRGGTGSARVPVTQSIRMTITPTQHGGTEAGDPQAGERRSPNRRRCRPRLQADQQEHGVLQQELDGRPVDPLAEPDCPVWMTGDLWPEIRPAVTTAMTPDP